MVREKITRELRKLTRHDYLAITTRGNAAIKSALSLVEGTVLIPAEGGWLEYKKVKNHVEVKCNDAKIDLNDLKNKLSSIKPSAIIYQNPGGYFAEQPLEEIYELCRENGCLVIVDVSGSIGTELCDGNFVDIFVGSFGRWKPVNAEAGGFISCKEKALFDRLEVETLDDEPALKKIKEKLDQLPQRLNFLQEKIKKIKEDLDNFNQVRVGEWGLVVVVRFSTDEEREKIINYCENNHLEYTECPRYIRLNEPAISIEIKRL